jgi:uncharacterized membrane protein
MAEMGALYSAAVLGSSVYLILWSFLLYSFLGAVIEMVFCLLAEGVLESRSGLLYLPLRPIYGLGGVANMLLLHGLVQEPILIFLFGIVIGSVVEYVASFVMEEAFGSISWDYSSKPLNLHGRICLQYSLCWGLLALLQMYLLDRVAFGFVDLFTRQVGEIGLTVLIVLTLLSAGITLAGLARIHRRITALEARARGEAVARSPTASDRLIDRLVPDRVIINTLPRMTLMTDFMDLTGEQRAWIRWRGHPCFALSAAPRTNRTRLTR